MIALWQTVIERLLNWPVAVLLLGLLFKEPITDFLSRIDLFKGKGAGVELELSVAGKANKQIEAESRAEKDPLALRPGPQQLELPVSNDTAERRERVIRYGGDDPQVLNHIKTVKEDLQTLQFALNSSETTEVLIRHLAVTQLFQRAEFMYRVIFGSQMAAVDKLNITGPQLETAIRPFYEKARNRSPRFYANYSFEQWVGFLINQNVVVLEEGHYAITLYGREFLEFVSSQGLPRKAH